ncbi:MAG: sulfate transporter [Massilia sp.]|jgi:nucleotide-binding universal stress UspA family protein|nr:sulfate transporter [Massilia sp.]
MFKQILLPTDGTAPSERAVVAGVDLARAIGAHVLGFTAVAPFHTLTLDAEMLEGTEAHYLDAARDRAARVLGFVSDAAQRAGVPCTCESTVAEDTYQAIIDTARERGCDLIVMASHGRRGVKAALLGSETQKVLVHSAIPVLVYR